LSFDAFPEARHGHILATYYEYLILFGGSNIRTEFLNDLWVY
jgi:hypothetical protein